jgi:hypothetical protein
MVSSTSPILKEAVEVPLGRDTYFHRDIVPEPYKDVRPESQQYRRTTPAPFKIAGKVTGVSPLRLEALTRGITGGLVTQFMPGKPEIGRSALTTAPVARTFFRSPYMESEDMRQGIEAAKGSEALRSVDIKRRAEGAYEEIKALPRREQQKRINEIHRGDPDVGEKMRSMFESDRLGIGYEERQLKTLGIADGTRARYLLDRVSKMSEADQKEYLQTLDRRGILGAVRGDDPPEVLMQLRRLQKGKPITRTPRAPVPER